MYVHKSVLLNEAIEGLNIKPDGIYVDTTTGGGGHSSLILSKLTTGHLYCFDQDEYAYKRSKEVLDPISKDNYTLIPSNFVNVKSELNKLGVIKIDGILYDLGVLSFQFDIPERGFSCNYDAPLEMRMNQNEELTAEIIVNTWSFNDLMRIFTRYGEDPFAKQIARAMERERAIKTIHTTFELVDVIKSAIPAKVLSKNGHPAKQTFQALRIAVNDELKVFEVSINDALDVLAPKGRAVVITFHSLEERNCKTVFKERSNVDIPEGVPLNIEALYELKTRKPVTASEEELKENNRAHSAKMRIIE
jgi:16S rRNA (cytosine1402-N4)-methyltransferase